jgi:hypothetical protein
MAATQHALWMLALPVLAACVAWQFSTRQPTFRRVLVALLLSLPVFFFPNHLCDAGWGGFQRFLGGICFAAVLTFSTNRRAAAVVGVVFALASIALISHYDNLVHGETYTGRRGDRSGTRSRKQWALEEARKEVESISADRIAAGWLSEQTEIAKSLAHSPKQHREAGEDVWHSGFTQLYRLRKVPVELWSPGGTPAEAADRLEWRDREPTPAQ